MATKFLDYTGLSHLWSKFKEWCNSIFVTKATDENITGTKTFVGSKKIAFKQSGANDKLGFTLFNNSGNEQGYLEYNPTNKIAGVPLMTLGNYATAASELTYVGFRRYSNISGASGAYNLLTPLISDAKSYFNLTTTYTNFYLPLGISDGTNIVKASNSGVIDISSLLPSVSTIEWSSVTSKPTTISGYGITDAKIDNGTITLGSNTITPLTSHQTLPILSKTISGSGNAITDITVSGHAITATKGSTFLTSASTLDATKLSGTIPSGCYTNTTYTAGTGLSLSGTQFSLASHTHDKLLSAGDNVVSTSTNTYASGYFNVRWFSQADKVPGQPSQYGFLATFATGDNASEVHQIWCAQNNGDLFHRGTNGSSYTSPPAFKKIIDSSNETQLSLTDSGSGNAVTAISVSGHSITVTKGSTFLTSVSGTAGTSLLAWNTENTIYTVGGHAIKVKLPANPNTDTHWTSHLYAGASNGNANAATTNGNTYLIICDNSTARDRRLIKGTGATTVTSDANGVITIHSTDNNTTYSTATQSANGLMSAADKKKLDGIAAGADSIPVGAIIYYTNKTVPANFLICNGGAVSRTTYATLFNVIGTTFGKGNGSSTFNVPNLIGRFPEGNATPGTVHNAGLPNITGNLNYVIFWNASSSSVGGVFNKDADEEYWDSNAGDSWVGRKYKVSFNASRSSSIYGNSTTVQPPALTLVPCIRYA